MKKIIICTVSIGLVLVVGLTALIMALVPVGQNNFIVKPTTIYFLNETTKKNDSEWCKFRSNYSQDEKDKLNELYRVFNEGFSQKALTALFKGELNDRVETHYEKSVGTENYVRRNGDSTHLTLVFEYSEEQTIKVDDRSYNYKYLFFQIDNSTERVEYLFGVSNSVSLDSSSNYLSYNYWFTTKMNATKLYDHIASLKFNVEGKPTQIIDSRA